MFNNVAIDVFLGLTFVFLLYSLLATILQEAIAGFLNLRAAVLVKAIRTMLNDRKRLDTNTSNPALRLWERFVFSLKGQWGFITCSLPDRSLAKAFYKHPSIKYLSSSSLRSKPSYINPSNFSATLVKMLRGRFYDGNTPEMVAIYQKLHVTPENELPIVNVGAVDAVMAHIQPETLDQLKQMYVDANQDIDKFKNLLEEWYNDTMDRANGWYKRLTKHILFILGFVLAFSGNVDTFKIYHILATNQTAREQMVQLAIQSQNKYANAPQVNNGAQANSADFNQAAFDSAYTTVQSDVKKANSILGLGRLSDEDKKAYKALFDKREKIVSDFKQIRAANPADPQLISLRSQLHQADLQLPIMREQMQLKEVGWSSFFGWIVTAFALTLGAPFWFDLLNRFISLRSAGKKPESSDSNTDDDKTSGSAQPVNVNVNTNANAAEEAVG